MYQQGIERNSSDDQGDSQQYLTFMLNGEEYGVEILRVQGIQGWDSVTPIPNSPEYVLGVMNLRGEIVPIIDLRKRFAMDTIPYGPTTVIVVVRVEGSDRTRTLGMVVDGVSEVYRIDNDEVQAMPEMGRQLRQEFVKGLSTVDDKMLILLDVDCLLSVDDIAKDSHKLVASA